MPKKTKKSKKFDSQTASSGAASLDWSWQWHLKTLGLIYAALGVMYFVLRAVMGRGA